MAGLPVSDRLEAGGPSLAGCAAGLRRCLLLSRKLHLYDVRPGGSALFLGNGGPSPGKLSACNSKRPGLGTARCIGSLERCPGVHAFAGCANGHSFSPLCDIPALSCPAAGRPGRLACRFLGRAGHWLVVDAADPDPPHARVVFGHLQIQRAQLQTLVEVPGVLEPRRVSGGLRPAF